MFGWLALLLLWTPQEPASSVARPAIVRSFEPTDLGVRRCLIGLKRDVSARITCRVNSLASVTACTFEPDTLTRGERDAVECHARAYRFRYEDGRSATGETVSFTVNLADD